MNCFRFAPARTGEVTVFGARRPGHPGSSIQQDSVDEWISFMKRNSIQRVCCLLSLEQLEYYEVDLLASYCNAFGPRNVCHVSVADYHLCSSDDLNEKILPFLAESDDELMPVVVHCSGGSGRTGHVLAAWLVRRRGLSVEAAVDAVRSTGRNPREAVGFGHATEETLRALLLGTGR